MPRSEEPIITDSGIEIAPVYRADEADCPEPDPGCFPFTRGIYPTMYRGRRWTMRQYAGFSSVEESNARYRLLLSRGTTGLSVAFDLPTQLGLDSDDERAFGEVGRVGVPISTVDDMRRLFDGIDQSAVTTSMTINAPAALLLLMYEIVAEERGVASSALGGTIQNDILKEYAARGTYIFPPRPSMRLVTDTFCVLRGAAAELEHDLGLRLPHARGRSLGGPGNRLHAGQWTRLHRSGTYRRFDDRPGRAADELLLRRPLQSV